MIEVKSMLLWSTIMSIVCTTSGDIKLASMAIGILFVLNITLGIKVDIQLNGEHFKFSKFRDALGLLFVFLCCIFCIALIGRLMDDVSLSIPAIKWVSYFFLYYIATNILKNLKQLYPKVWVFGLLYDVLTMTFTKKLKEFGLTLKKRSNESNS